MSDRLVCAFAVGGGIPPATYEALRIYEDGAARVIVGNAWPFGAPQDEAGSYEHRLEAAELAALRGAVADAAAAAAGDRATGDQQAGGAAPAGAGAPFTADAGRCELVLGWNRRIAWPTTAAPPDGLAPVVERMRGLLTDTRAHPVAAVAVALAPPAAAAAGEPVGLDVLLRNPGIEPVGLAGGRFQVRTAPANGGGPPDLEALAAAAPLDVALPAGLAPGERRTLAARTTVRAPGRWRIDVLARLDADLPYEGDRLRLECVALAGPVLVEVGA